MKRTTLVVAIVFGTLWMCGVLAQIPRVGRICGAAVGGNYLVLLPRASNGAKSVVANILAVAPPRSTVPSSPWPCTAW